MDGETEFKWGCIAAIGVLAYGGVQLYAGALGIGHHLGSWWAAAAIVAAFLFRLSLPITIGAFYGARDVWGWHWGWALVFAAPGLAFMALMIPSLLASAIQSFRGRAA